MRDRDGMGSIIAWALALKFVLLNASTTITQDQLTVELAEPTKSTVQGPAAVDQAELPHGQHLEIPHCLWYLMN